MFPLVELAEVLIELVVDVPAQPPGNVQVYEVAPGTAVILYILNEPSQITVLPEILPGVAGTELTVTANVCAGEVPQELLAVTVIFPLVAPAVVLIEFVVDVPLQPPGKVHV